MLIRAMDHADSREVLDTYAAGIAGGLATFETEVPGWERFDASRRPDHRWAAERGGVVLGTVTISQVSAVIAYGIGFGSPPSPAPRSWPPATAPPATPPSPRP